MIDPQPQSSIGRLTLITGCMFAGKTTVLFRHLEQYPKDRILLIKHVIDRRYRADAVVSHGGKAWPAASVASAKEVPIHLGSTHQMMALDEAHFFDGSLVDFVRAWKRRPIDMLMTALDLDSWGRPFPVVERLAELADEPLRLQAQCARCGRSADHTQRLTPILDGNMVGGPESYEPRCRNCWHPPPESPPPSGSQTIRSA